MFVNSERTIVEINGHSTVHPIDKLKRILAQFYVISVGKTFANSTKLSPIEETFSARFSFCDK